MADEDPPLTLPAPKAAAKVSRTPNDTLVSHADRLWNSAVQNATRISGRVQIIGGGILVMTGIVFTVGASIDKATDWPREPSALYALGIAVVVLSRVGSIIAVYYFARAIARLYIRDPEPPGMAADLMEIQRGDENEPIKLMVFRRTYRAYLELRKRNEREKRRLAQAQRWLAKGLVVLVGTAILYLVTSAVPKFLPQGDGHDNSTGQAGNQSQPAQGGAARGGA
jgi:hypothetical protein